jgi:hypothetical protein
MSSAVAATPAPGGILATLGFVTEAQVAADLNISAKTLANHRCAGTGPRYLKKGHVVLYKPEHIREWLEGGAS